MKEFQQRRKTRNFFYSRATQVVLLLLVVLLARSTWNVYQKSRESEARREIKEKELAELKSRAETLSREVARLNTPKGIEEEIREQFNVAKEGEQVAVILDEKNSTSTGEVQDEGFWHSILRFFHIQ